MTPTSADNFTLIAMAVVVLSLDFPAKYRPIWRGVVYIAGVGFVALLMKVSAL